jgi:DNA polymerase-3 subunit beta
MKADVAAGVLARAVDTVCSVVARRTPTEILNHLLLTTTANAITLTATNLDMMLTARLPAEVMQEGSVTLPARGLGNAVAKLPPDGVLSLSGSGSESLVELRGARTRLAMPSLPPEDFPSFPTDNFSHQFSLPAAELMWLIGAVNAAIGTEEARLYLCGVYLHAKGDTLCAVAADGLALAEARLRLPSGAEGMPGVIVPRQAVELLARPLKAYKGDATLALNTNKIQIDLGNIALVSKLIDGTFPEYQRVIPQRHDRALETDRVVFMRAVELVATLAEDVTKIILVEAEGNSGVVSLDPVRASQFAGEVGFDCTHSGRPIRVGLNSRQLSELVAPIGTRLLVELDGDDAGNIKLGDAGDQRFLIVMGTTRI